MCVIVGAVVDTAVYLATTDSSQWNVGDAAGAVVSGAIESAVNPFAKIGKVTKLVSAAQKVYSKFSKAGRAGKSLAGTFRRGGRNTPTIKIVGPPTGPYTTFRRHGETGRVTHYATMKPQTNPLNPNRFQLHKRFDAAGGKPHFNKATKRYVPTPHVQGGRILGGVRTARRWETPL